MARDFTKNTANYLSATADTLGPLVNGASAISVGMWALWDTLEASGTAANSDLFAIPINGSRSGLTIHLNYSTGTNLLIVGGRSVSTDSLQSRTSSSAIDASTTYHIGGVFNIGGDTITPYINGSANNGGTVTFGNATYTNGTPTTKDSIGCAMSGSTPISTTRQMDGMIAEFGLWNVALAAGEFAALAAGYSPLCVRPQSLVAYFPLHNDANWCGSGALATTGTVGVRDHPRIIYPRRRTSIIVPAAAAGAPTITALSSRLITSTSAQPRISYS